MLALARLVAFLFNIVAEECEPQHVEKTSKCGPGLVDVMSYQTLLFLLAVAVKLVIASDELWWINILLPRGGRNAIHEVQNQVITLSSHQQPRTTQKGGIRRRSYIFPPILIADSKTILPDRDLRFETIFSPKRSISKTTVCA